MRGGGSPRKGRGSSISKIVWWLRPPTKKKEDQEFRKILVVTGAYCVWNSVACRYVRGNDKKHSNIADMDSTFDE